MHNKKLILACFFMHQMSFSFIMYLFVCHFVRLIALGKVVFFPPTYLVHCISTYTMQPSPSHHTNLDKVLLTSSSKLHLSALPLGDQMVEKLRGEDGHHSRNHLYSSRTCYNHPSSCPHHTFQRQQRLSQYKHIVLKPNMVLNYLIPYMLLHNLLHLLVYYIMFVLLLIPYYLLVYMFYLLVDLLYLHFSYMDHFLLLYLVGIL